MTERRRREASRLAPRRRSPASLSSRGARASLLASAFLFVGVFPTRALPRRSGPTSPRPSERLGVLEERNEELAERVDALGTDEEIERLAREQYNLV